MKQKALLIDDQAVVRESFEFLLQDKYDIVHAESADEGIAKFMSEGRFDFVICNVGLKSQMDGFEVCNMIRGHDHHMKVWLTSAHMPKERKEMAYSVGADRALTTDEAFELLRRNAPRHQTAQAHRFAVHG